MQVRIDTIFFLIYCATAVHPKKQQRNRLDNEVLDKSEVMLKFANNIFNMPEEKPTKNFRRNAVHTKVEPVEGRQPANIFRYLTPRPTKLNRWLNLTEY